MDRTQLINFGNGLAGAGRGNLGVPLLLLVMMGMMMLSVPPFLLDLLFTFNIAVMVSFSCIDLTISFMNYLFLIATFLKSILMISLY